MGPQPEMVIFSKQICKQDVAAVKQVKEHVEGGTGEWGGCFGLVDPDMSEQKIFELGHICCEGATQRNLSRIN